MSMTWYDYDNAPDPAEFVDQNGPDLEPCEHEYTVTETDNWGNEYTVCEDCALEVEPEDTRSFYRDDETGRICW